MAYGTLKCDNIVFDNGGTDKLVTVSGLFFSTSGALTVTGTISGGNVTAPTATFTTLTGTTTAGTTATFTSGSFTTLTGTTVTGTTANFVSGVFTTQISGASITGTTVTATTGNYTSLTGVTTTGTTANFVSGVFTTQISGATITGTTVATTTGSFVSLTGTTATFTSGIIASGTAALPSLAILSDLNTGIYSPGADQLAISTGGVGKVFVDASGNVAIAQGLTPSFTKSLNIIALNAAIALRANSGGLYADQGIFFAVDGITYAQIYNEGIGQLIFRTGSGLSERARIDSSGRLLVGASTARNNFFNAATSSIFQVEGAGGAPGRITSQVFGAANVNGPIYVLAKHRGAAVGGTDVINDADQLGTISFQGSDGTEFVEGATIAAFADGTPGANDMPGRLVFSTTADGAASPTERMRISNAGTTTLTSATSTAPFIAKINTSEVARIDSSGRLLVGTSSARATYLGAGISAGINVEAAGSLGANNRAISVVNGWSAGADGGASVYIGRTRSDTIGGTAAVQNFDQIGNIYFVGSDGTNLLPTAVIRSEVDGTPGTNDMPGRLMFFTTADGASSTTERLRITSAGVLQIAEAGNITVGTTTGTKIGTATTQKIGFYNATPVVQPAAVANATTAVDVITQLNDLLAKLRTLGIIAT